MRRILIVFILVIGMGGFAAAGTFVFHAGAGYQSSYVGTITDLEINQETLKALPLGLGGYAGVGYGLNEDNTISLGLEYSFHWDVSITPFKFTNFSNQFRAFAKFKPTGFLTLAAFGGVSGDILKAFDDTSAGGSTWAGVVGGRITVLFLYAEYAAVFNENSPNIKRHEFGLGFAFLK